jgi:hypothetical protein
MALTAATGTDLAVQLSDRWAPRVAPPMQRFAAQHEIRLYLSVDLKTFCLAAIEGGQRRRDAENLAVAAWEDLAPLLNDLVGVPMLHGVTAQLRQRFAARPGERPLFDAADGGADADSHRRHVRVLGRLARTTR